MCVIVLSWVQAAHLLRSLTFQIKDDVNDPVWLFVLQFVLQLLWILKGAFGLKQCCLWSRLNCLTGWKIKIYLHICEALWQSHCASELLTCTPIEEKFKGFVQAQVISIFYIVYFYKDFFLSINPHSFQCYTHLQYMNSDSTICAYLDCFTYSGSSPTLSPKLPLHLHFLPGPSAGSPSSDLSHSEPHEWTIVPFTGAPWP